MMILIDLRLPADRRDRCKGRGNVQLLETTAVIVVTTGGHAVDLLPRGRRMDHCPLSRLALQQNV